jgi:hypothetical protein
MHLAGMVADGLGALAKARVKNLVSVTIFSPLLMLGEAVSPEGAF